MFKEIENKFVKGIIIFIFLADYIRLKSNYIRSKSIKLKQNYKELQ